MMRGGHILVDPAEAAHIGAQSAVGHEPKQPVSLGFPGECDLCAGNQTYGDVGLSGSREAAGEASGEGRHDKMAMELGRRRRDTAQTVVAHHRTPVARPALPPCQKNHWTRTLFLAR